MDLAVTLRLTNEESIVFSILKKFGIITWDYLRDEHSVNSMRVTICRLRKKLESAGMTIVSVPLEGYKLEKTDGTLASNSTTLNVPGHGVESTPKSIGKLKSQSANKQPS